MASSTILQSPTTDVTNGVYSTAPYRLTEGKFFSVYVTGDLTDVEVLVYVTNHVEPDTSIDKQWTLVDREVLDTDDPYFLEGEIGTISHIYVKLDASAGSFLNGYLRILVK